MGHKANIVKLKKLRGMYSYPMKVQLSGILPGDLFSKLNPTGFFYWDFHQSPSHKLRKIQLTMF